MDAYRNVVIAIPGLADSEPGDTLQAIAAGLPGPPGSYRRSDLVLGRDRYPRLVSSAPALPDLLEVHGAHRQPPVHGWRGALHHMLGLSLGLAAVRFDWCAATPPMRTQQAYRDVVEGLLLWSAWPVLLALIQAVAAPSGPATVLALQGLLVVLLAFLARRQSRVTLAGYAWLGLCLGFAAALWFIPSWAATATQLSIRVYGLTQLIAVTALLALAGEVVVLGTRGALSWRRGLAALNLAVVPLGLLSLLGACVWALVLNAILVVGSPAALAALKGWQQTFAKCLGYPLASVEWAAAILTAAVAVLVLSAAAHTVLRCRGAIARRWLSAILVVIPVGFALVGLLMLLTSPYLGAPLAKGVQRWGDGASVAAIYTGSALRLLPWLALLATPAWLVLDVLGDIGYYLMPPDEPGLSSRSSRRERLAQLLRFVDRGRYDRIHVIAHSQGTMLALDVLRGATLNHPLALTTLGSPAGTLYRHHLDWPLAGAGDTPADWRNLFYQGDPIGGPVGIENVDAMLPGGGHSGYWLDPRVADRVIEVLNAPLPVPAP